MKLTNERVPEGAFNEAQVRSGGDEVDRPCEAVERFEVLDRVLLHARAKRVLHDGVKVHEQPSPEHAVGIGFSGCVAPH